MPATQSSPAPAHVSATGILEVPDPRARRGIRHRLAVILSVALAAVCAGARSFTAIAEWAQDAPPDVLAGLGIEGRPPSESTIRRTLARIDAAALDQAISARARLRTSKIDGRRVVAVDGITLRGAKDAAGHLTHLLAALDQGAGVILGQLEVGAKTIEIPLITDLLDPLDLTDTVVTADAIGGVIGAIESQINRGNTLHDGRARRSRADRIAKVVRRQLRGIEAGIFTPQITQFPKRILHLAVHVRGFGQARIGGHGILLPTAGPAYT